MKPYYIYKRGPFWYALNLVGGTNPGNAQYEVIGYGLYAESAAQHVRDHIRARLDRYHINRMRAQDNMAGRYLILARSH